MTAPPAPPRNLPALDDATRGLVELAVSIANDGELALRAAMVRSATARIDPVWVEELILQSHLFSGFPRALNAAREWRRASGRHAPNGDPDADPAPARVRAWYARGQATCATVYGDTYERLRANIRELHPALDAWMIVDGYGKVLGRPQLDLRRRELCIVAVCAVGEHDRQLHAHLRGAINAGASPADIDDVLEIVTPRVSDDAARRFRLLWDRVRAA
ncbi:MAG TPA: carboxymuconolactone decarboxylase family protein [Gemmatimonadaceae bacterium]|jgi:4-carboxymuconolactone decarboxylase|nr:carboxymuconolactone decarboxylase family protein [Gemmatimonadaceae bacterium]